MISFYIFVVITLNKLDFPVIKINRIKYHKGMFVFVFEHTLKTNANEYWRFMDSTIPSLNEFMFIDDNIMGKGKKTQQLLKHVLMCLWDL